MVGEEERGRIERTRSGKKKRVGERAREGVRPPGDGTSTAGISKPMAGGVCPHAYFSGAVFANGPGPSSSS